MPTPFAITALLALTLCGSPALALAQARGPYDWGVVPAAAWASDATVTVGYELRDETATGALIGSAQTLSGPWSLTVPKVIAGAQFNGTGRKVCVVARAVRGTVQSGAVSVCDSFQLDGPTLLGLPAPQ